jgi:plasmid stability protein
MKNIQIRNVPERTHSVLRRRAAQAGMSLQEYLLALVNDVSARPTVEEVLRRAGGHSGGRVRFADAAADIRSDRNAG